MICKTNFLKFGIPKVRKGKRLKDDPKEKGGILANYDVNDTDVDGRNNTPDLFGPLWLTASYIVLLTICANLNDYFISGNDQYIFNTDYFSVIIGIVLIYTLAEALVYKAVVGCLKGDISTSEVFFYFKIEHVPGRIFTSFVFHSNDILCHTVALCAYYCTCCWRLAQSNFLVQKLWQIPLVQKIDPFSSIPIHLTTLLLHPDKERILQLQKLLHLIRNSCSFYPSCLF